MSATEAATSFENITYEVKGSTAYITMNRPKVMNALNRKTVEKLNSAFHAAKEDVAVKGVILTGDGEKAFIAGADIAELSAIDRDRAGGFSEKGRSRRILRINGLYRHGFLLSPAVVEEALALLSTDERSGFTGRWSCLRPPRSPLAPIRVLAWKRRDTHVCHPKR